MKKIPIVTCSCGGHSDLSLLSMISIEKDQDGRELVTFECPICGEEATSNVCMEVE